MRENRTHGSMGGGRKPGQSASPRGPGASRLPDQQIALDHLVWLALDRLRSDPLVEGDCYPGDLLASVLRVDAAFWEPSLDLEVEARKLAESVRDRLGLEPGLRELIETFIQDHPARSAARFSD